MIEQIVNSKKIRAGIIGGAGYTGGEMLRILVNHPNVEITFVNSTSNAGNLVSDVHTDLIGDTDLRFVNDIPQDIDVLFCALAMVMLRNSWLQTQLTIILKSLICLRILG